MHTATYRLAAFALLLAFLPARPDAQAQSYSQTARAFVQSPAALGTGDVGAALPGANRVFFYNPAHLTSTTSRRPRINILGVRSSASSNLSDQYAFYRDDLEPAVDEGIENLDADRLERLYDEARRLGRRRAFLSGDVLLPSITAKVGGGLSLGAGIFGHSLVRYRFEDAGAGIPAIDLVGQADAIGLVSGALDFSSYGFQGLSLGLSGKYTRRYLTVKAKPLDAFEEDEDFYLLRGSSAGVDVGLHYAPGRWAVGIAAFDLLASDYNYQYDRNLTRNAPVDEAKAAAEAELANRRYGLDSSYRLGAAYTLPARWTGLFRKTTLAADYVGYADPRVEQSTLAHLRLGVRTSPGGGPVHLRAGVSQGYPTAGVGLQLSFMTFDYAFYGVEEGRLPGQVPSWNHTVQLAFGLF